MSQASTSSTYGFVSKVCKFTNDSMHCNWNSYRRIVEKADETLLTIFSFCTDDAKKHIHSHLREVLESFKLDCQDTNVTTNFNDSVNRMKKCLDAFKSFILIVPESSSFAPSSDSDSSKDLELVKHPFEDDGVYLVPRDLILFHVDSATVGFVKDDTRFPEEIREFATPTQVVFRLRWQITYTFEVLSKLYVDSKPKKKQERLKCLNNDVILWTDLFM
jgi:hypothetical protein